MIVASTSASPKRSRTSPARRAAGLRETLELCREGRTLVELCAAELEAVGRGLEELRLEELVARLEAGAATRGG